jgi:hypothetical protein
MVCPGAELALERLSFPLLLGKTVSQGYDKLDSALLPRRVRARLRERFMLRLLERNIASVEQRLVVVVPPQTSLSPHFKNVTVDSARHRQLVEDMQRLRGSVYLHDGAVGFEQLTADGLHQTAEDEQSWHLLMLGPDGRVSSCVWYLEHENTARVEQLRVRHCPLAQNGWKGILWRAVESELAHARRDGLRYGEVGGWAVTKRSRCTSEGLLLALAAYSLGRIRGGALGMTTATVRHSSSTILRRLGGSHLEYDGIMVPSYYDPTYSCEMELLRFDSRRPDPKYVDLVELLRGKLGNVSAVTSDLVPQVEPYRYVAPGSKEQPQFAA